MVVSADAVAPPAEGGGMVPEAAARAWPIEAASCVAATNCAVHTAGGVPCIATAAARQHRLVAISDGLEIWIAIQTRGFSI